MPSHDDVILKLRSDRLVQSSNGGLFVSRGHGIHPQRVIQSWELIFVRSGVLHIREQDRQFTVAPNQYLILQPGLEHAGTQTYADDLSFYWVHFDLPSDARRKSQCMITLTQHAQPRRPDRLTELLHRFLDDQVNQAHSPLAANCQMMLMLNEAADTIPVDQQASQSANSLAPRAEKYIASHAHESISTSDVAEHLNCNPDYLGQVFRHTFGMTLTQAIIKQRLTDARKLLMDSQLNIDQVARTCGFATPGYFRRVFQASEGLSPRQYRKLHLRLHINWR
jgi:AraC-like DNA-binding protein